MVLFLFPKLSYYLYICICVYVCMYVSACVTAYECTELNDEDSNLESVFDGWVNVVNKSNLNSLSKGSY